MHFACRAAASIVILFGMPVRAQLFPAPQDRMFWKERSVVRFEFRGANIVEEFLGEPIREKRYGNIGDLSEFHFIDGMHYGVKKIKKDAKPRIDIYSSNDGVNWSVDATLLTPIKDQPDVARVLYIGSGRYLLLAGFTPFKVGNSESYIAMGRKSVAGKEIQFDQLVELNFPSKDSQAMKQAVGPIFNPLVCFAQDACTLALPRAGLIWSFSTKGKGSIKLRHRAIYRDAWEAMANGDRIENAILGMQPMSDGSFVIATRTRDGVLNGMKAASGFAPERKVTTTTLKMDDGKDKSAALESFLKRRVEEDSKTAFSDAKNLSVKAYPEIKWWEYDPATNNLHETNPPGVKTILNSSDDIHKFKFRIRPDGRIVFG